MRKFFKSVALVMAMATFGIPATAADLFPSLYDSPDIETVYVSKNMMLNSNQSRSILYQQLHIYDSKDLEDLYVYSARNPEGIALAEKTVKDFKDKNKNLEILMRTKTEKEESVIYGMLGKDDGYYSNIIIINKGKNYSMVVLSGNIKFEF